MNVVHVSCAAINLILYLSIIIAHIYKQETQLRETNLWLRGTNLEIPAVKLLHSTRIHGNISHFIDICAKCTPTYFQFNNVPLLPPATLSFFAVKSIQSSKRKRNFNFFAFQTFNWSLIMYLFCHAKNVWFALLSGGYIMPLQLMKSTCMGNKWVWVISPKQCSMTTILIWNVAWNSI